MVLRKRLISRQLRKRLIKSHTKFLGELEKLGVIDVVGSISAAFSSPVYVPPREETAGRVSGGELEIEIL